MNILDLEVMKGFIRMCNDGLLQGWHERNGGNLTYRMNTYEVKECSAYFHPKTDWVPMGVKAENLAGEYFISTGSGKFMRNVILEPQNTLCIVEINEAGDSWRIDRKSVV